MLSEKRATRIKNVALQRRTDIVLVLEDIHDPHNAEAIFRTCDALGIQDVYLIFDTTKEFNPRKIGKNSSSSANKWLDFHVFRSTKACLDYLVLHEYALVATVLRNGIAFDECTLPKGKIALMVGNEHSGLSEQAIARSELRLSISMKGFVESLNVSVATALFLYEIVRQRGLSRLDAEALIKMETRLMKRSRG